MQSLQHSLRRQLLASMGPQLYRCGNFTVDREWIVDGYASMGPQLYRCGNKAAYRDAVEYVMEASMGPQLYRCGNLRRGEGSNTVLSCFNGAATLSLRKCDGDDVACIRDAGLQWGRNFIVAEMPRGRSLRPPGCSARFNGAATLSLRKYVKWQIVDFAVGLVASMGPQLYRCGNASRRPTSTHATNSLQWGRNFIVAEMAPWGR